MKEKQGTNEARPYVAQKRTYLQGTMLKLFEYHCELHSLKTAEYLRQLVIRDLKSSYEINATGGVVRVRRSGDDAVSGR